jgi:hypothetical protein
MGVKRIKCSFEILRSGPDGRRFRVNFIALDKTYEIILQPHEELDDMLKYYAMQELLPMLNRQNIPNSLESERNFAQLVTVEVSIFIPLDGYILSETITDYSPDALMDSMVLNILLYLQLNHKKDMKLLRNYYADHTSEMLPQIWVDITNLDGLEFISFLSPHMPIHDNIDLFEINALHWHQPSDTYIALGPIFLDERLPVVSIFGKKSESLLVLNASLAVKRSSIKKSSL